MERGAWLFLAGLAALALHACSGRDRGFNASGSFGVGPGGPTTSTVTTGSGSVSSTTGGGGASGSLCGNLIYGSSACHACVEGFCCQELADCTSGTDCQGLHDCLDACGDDSTCTEGCVGKFPMGLENHSALIDCVSNSCSGDCEGHPICDSGFTEPDKACAECLSTECCPEYSACFGDNDCNLCIILADEAACENTTLDDIARTCRMDNCSPTCTTE